MMQDDRKEAATLTPAASRGYSLTRLQSTNKRDVLLRDDLDLVRVTLPSSVRLLLLHSAVFKHRLELLPRQPRLLLQLGLQCLHLEGECLVVMAILLFAGYDGVALLLAETFAPAESGSRRQLVYKSSEPGSVAGTMLNHA